MPKAFYHFPEEFIWGTATASHQVEGQNNNNNWSEWEKQPGKIIHDQKAGLACDWWGGRWKEDLDRAAETGQNAHRLSIEWSRIQPEEGRWDEDALDHYRTILRGAVQRGLKPVVTLHHFTDPLWLVERGGWENDRTPEWFAEYTRRVVEALKQYVSLWVTINEPNIYVFGYLGGVFPPGKNDLKVATQVYANLLRGHARAYQTIHTIQPQASVGVAISYRSFRPEHSWSLLDKQVVGFQNRMFNDVFMNTLINGRLDMLLHKINVPEAVNTLDYVGINYYTRDIVRFNLFKPGNFFASSHYPADAEVSDNGFMANVPEGMFDALKWAMRFKKPIYVTENGIEDADDDLRPRYLIQHVHQIWRAVNFNFPVRGYFHWSLVDNFEWERGWTQRFGLWGLDVESQARIRRKSVDVYETICKENGISSQMVETYALEIYKKLFPG